MDLYRSEGAEPMATAEIIGPAPPQYYLWWFPGSPVKVHLALSVVQRIEPDGPLQIGRTRTDGYRRDYRAGTPPVLSLVVPGFSRKGPSGSIRGSADRARWTFTDRKDQNRWLPPRLSGRHPPSIISGGSRVLP